MPGNPGMVHQCGGPLVSAPEVRVTGLGLMIAAFIGVGEFAMLLIGVTSSTLL
jgi:hypothetical protein